MRQSLRFPNSASGGIALILGLSLLNYCLRFVRWQLYLSRLGYDLPHGLSLRYYLAGFAFTTTPGKAGEAVRSLYLKRHGISYSQSLSALFARAALRPCGDSPLVSARRVVFWQVPYLSRAEPPRRRALLILVLQNHKVRVWLRERVVTRLPDKLARPAGHALNMMEAASSLLTPPLPLGWLGTQLTRLGRGRGGVLRHPRVHGSACDLHRGRRHLFARGDGGGLVLFCRAVWAAPKRSWCFSCWP